MATPLRQQADALADQLTHWRRALHANPELSGQERQTAAFVAQQLRQIGLQPREGVGGGFGLTAEVSGPAPGPTVALRADMDALPIHEETGLPFKSALEGVMHACGHDAHTAMLLGAARLLHENRHQLAGSVRLIFQPHEEVFPGGAAAMIADGALAGCERVFGLHISSHLPLGTIGARAGPFMACVNRLAITIRGRGGHAAMPETTIDAVVVAAQLILSLQTVVSRNIAMTDAAVVSVTTLQAGTADNVIAPEVRLTGTIRTYEDAVRARVCKRIEEIAAGVCQAFGASCEVMVESGYPALVNDAAELDLAHEAARQVGFDPQRILTIPAQGGGEDFAYYCQHARGAFVFLGASPGEGRSFPHHHPRFDVDERALPLGAALLAQHAVLAQQAADDLM